MSAAKTETSETMILVVDDDEPLLRMVESVLHTKGYSVVAAHNGDEALHWCLNHGAPDLLLTDVRMPAMDGGVLYQKLSGQFPHMPVLFMSGTAGDDPDFVLTPLLRKPFGLTELMSTIRSLLLIEQEAENHDTCTPHIQF